MNLVSPHADEPPARNRPMTPRMQWIRRVARAPAGLHRPLWLRILAASAAWFIALGATLLFASPIERATFTFFWAAILFAAWFSGWIIAVVLSVASVIAVNYFLMEPSHQFGVPKLPDLMLLFIFMVVASAVSALTDRLAEDDRATRARADELARLNERLIAQQRELAARTDAAQALVREVEAANAGLAIVNSALEESEQRWQTLTDIAPVFIWTADARGECTWVSRPWLDFTGRALDAELGRGWLTALHDEDRPRTLVVYERAIAAREPFTLEFRLRRRDGEYRWITNRGVPRHSEEGTFIGFIGSCIDLSERRSAEEWSRGLQALGASLTRATRSVEVVESATRDAARVVGAQSCDLVELTNDGERLELVRRMDPEIERAGVNDGRIVVPRGAPEWQAIATAAPVVIEQLGEWRALHSDVALVAASDCESLVALPLILEGRRAGALTFGFATKRTFAADDLAFLSAVSDLCAQALDRVRLFEAELRARREADAANRSKSEFLAQLSHELRTPLNAVGGYADLLAMEIHGPISDPQRVALSRLKRAQQELLTHIDELLTFARVDRAQQTYAFAPVRASAIIREVEALVSPQAGVKGIELAIAPIDPDLCGWGDRDRVRQILLNLTTNAIKYTPNGGRVELSARSRVTARGDTRVDFEVSDTGRGIPAEKLEAIFDPFVQLTKRPFEPRDGVGLGLAIARRLATDMDGELTVSSAIDVGSTFRLSVRSAEGMLAAPETMAVTSRERT